MTFRQAIVTCFRKFADFEGRASPSEYAWFRRFFGVAAGSGLVAVWALWSTGHVGWGIAVWLLFMVVVGTPMEAVTWRRYHDMGRSGAWSMLKTGLRRPGDLGWNQYGPPPGETSGEQPAATSSPAPRRVTPTPGIPQAPAVFVPCPGCDKVINRDVGRCPYCRTDLGPAR